MAIQTNPGEAFIHYSDSSDAYHVNSFRKQAAAIRSFQDYHMDTHGWSDIGYHYVVCQPAFPLMRARVFACRNTTYVPAAQLNHNTGTVAICVLAGPKNRLYRNTRYVLEELLKLHRSVKVVGGHRDVVSTDCPGDNIYAEIPRIARIAGKKTYK